MRAARIHRFGPPEVIALEDVAVPVPAAGEVLVRVAAAGVGPWDGWVRAGKSALPQPLPLTLGADIAGTVEAIGAGVSGLSIGEAVFGVSNARFTGGYAEYAAASAAMIAHKPKIQGFPEAAALPVVAVTAWQMLFEQARLAPGQTVLVLGAAGNVGRLAIQLAHNHGLHVIAAAAMADADTLRGLGADTVIDIYAAFERAAAPVDAVLDLVGGAIQERSFAALKRGGVLVSSVSAPDRAKADDYDVRANFFLVDVNTATLARLAAIIDAGNLSAAVGRVLPLSDVIAAHEMLEGTRQRPKGKIVLDTTPGRD